MQIEVQSIDSVTDRLNHFAHEFAEVGLEKTAPRLSELLDVVENLRLQYPDHHRLAYVHSLILRLLGRLDEGLAVAREVLENANDFDSIIGLATALREAGRLEESVAAYQRAHRIDPESASVLLDIGDIYFDLDQIGNGLKAYQQSLQLEPDQEWAIASIEYGRLRMSGDPAHLDRLDDLAAAGNERAAMLAMAATPFFGFLPAPTDATIVILRQIDLRGPIRGSVQITLTGDEPPSARMAIDRWAAAKALLGVEVSIVHAAQTLLSEPAKTAVSASHVETLASIPYDANRWFDLAQQSALPNIADLAACMAHPPDPGTHRFSPWTWIQRMQFAAAMMIATFDLEVPWKDSQRRKVLYDLIQGQHDWSSAAAIVALTTGVMNGTADADEAREWLLQMAQRCEDESLVFALLMFPSLDHALRTKLRARRAAFLD
ncbi:MAG TPA: tetratricopeptide repeat protein [Thermoanaerobaculia bacterium]